jgi:hypothetical protein
VALSRHRLSGLACRLYDLNWTWSVCALSFSWRSPSRSAGISWPRCLRSHMRDLVGHLAPFDLFREL